MNKIILFSVLFLFSLFFITYFSVSECYAQQNLNDWSSVLEKGGGPSGAGYRTDIVSPEPVIAIVIRAALSFLGVLFLILMVYGGFLWMTARGNEDQVVKAKNLIIAAIIGLIIILASYAISYFVIDALTENTLDF